MFQKLLVWVVGILSKVLVLVSQAAVLIGSDTKYWNLGYPSKNTENRQYAHEKWYEWTYTICDVSELYFIRIVEVHYKVLVLISHETTLNWRDTIGQYLGYPSQKCPKIDILAIKSNLIAMIFFTLAITNATETFLRIF